MLNIEQIATIKKCFSQWCEVLDRESELKEEIKQIALEAASAMGSKKASDATAIFKDMKMLTEGKEPKSVKTVSIIDQIRGSKVSADGTQDETQDEE